MYFAVLGGDGRQSALARLLAEDGHAVRTFGTDPAAGTITCDSPAAAAGRADFTVLPLPVSDGRGVLNAPSFGGKIGLGEVFAAIGPGQTAFAGRAGEDARRAAEAAGVELIDYFGREELTVRNAALTAEGAVQLLMEELPVSLMGARCLVVGFGRIGRLLALKLRALGAEVTASARKAPDFAWIEVMGCRWADTRTLGPELSCFDAVVNTAPAPVLDEKRLSYLKKSCVLLDLASKPGGTDMEAAERLGVKAFGAPGLPGRTSPVSAAAVIRDTIYNIISELGCAC